MAAAPVARLDAAAIAAIQIKNLLFVFAGYEKKHLSAADRFGILDDSFFLSMACQQSFASLLLVGCLQRGT
ncbi:hypothetical protein L3X38_020444 [Prunus dulcis]|uniref:Uncharacterized protein n=1 Tax=Prunus dulcis TaxID=3755 RepID=A0AAD4ZCN8_PRUDU|nr:hypothetical protein L3X38_020444 [Prunus dulcis]